MTHLFIMTKELFLLFAFFFFQITATFTAKYNNFSNWNALEKCKTLTIISFKKLSVIKTIFDNVSCGDSHLNRTILKEFRIEGSHEQCSNGMEIHNVTRSSGGTFGVYCGNTINIISLSLSLIFYTKSYMYYRVITTFILVIEFVLLSLVLSKLTLYKNQ